MTIRYPQEFLDILTSSDMDLEKIFPTEVRAYQKKEKVLKEQEQDRIDIINDILIKVDTPNKELALVLGLLSVSGDRALFLAKMLQGLDDDMLTYLKKDLNDESEGGTDECSGDN